MNPYDTMKSISPAVYIVLLCGDLLNNEIKVTQENARAICINKIQQ
jgi:hypothetical protein